MEVRDSNGTIDHSNPPPKKPTTFTNILGTTFAAVAKLAIFQPLDTITTNATAGKEKLARLWSNLSQAKPLEKVQILYKGSVLEFFKKWPSNSYRFTVQHSTEQYLNNHYGEQFSEMFGKNANVVISASSGGLTALGEPLFFQALDTAQVNQQVLQKPIFYIFENFSVRQLYRATIVTSVLRNFPSGVMLFGGSSMLNNAMNNEDKHSDILNITAKTGGGLASLVVSQPGEVLKVKMQINQWKFSEAWRNVTMKELFSNGFKFRLLGGVKAGAGFFLAEKGMKYAADMFGEEVKGPSCKKV